MKINKENSNNRGSMKKLFFRALYLFIGSALIFLGGFFLYAYLMKSVIELILLIGVIFVTSGFWMVYRLAYKPRDKMEISTKIAIIVIIIAWFATVIYLFFPPSYLAPPVPQEPEFAQFYLSIHKVDYEPEYYFVLDEEGRMYPFFRSVLDEMEAEGKEAGYIAITLEDAITTEEVGKIGIEYGYFKYEGNFYAVTT